MNKSGDLLKMERKYVLIFDICSSTKIVDQLILEDQEESWLKLLRKMEEILKYEKETFGFEIYKFTGDGWILLFKDDLPPNELFSFIDHLKERYAFAYRKIIGKVLSIDIDKIGITFGLDMGRLYRFRMFGNDEYIGRSIIIATRLQAAIGENDRNPQGKMLMSKSVYRKVKKYIPADHKVMKVKRNLRNVSGGEKYYAIKYEKRKMEAKK
jgi:hypothetical protein